MYNGQNGQEDYLSIGEDITPAVYLVRFDWLCGAIGLPFVGVLQPAPRAASGYRGSCYNASRH